MTSDSNPHSEMCVWVLASGPYDGLQVALLWADKPDKVIAADGGTALAEQIGIRPDLVVGDLDSSPPDLVERFAGMGIEIRRYSHDAKWETDSELAVLAALDWKPSKIILLGALGGRLDHSLANILLLTHPQLAALNVRILDGNHEVFLAKPERWNSVRGHRGDTVTLLPLGVDAKGVRTTGLHWPLVGETLPVGRGRGVSNLVDADEPSVWLDAGQLLVITLHQ